MPTASRAQIASILTFAALASLGPPAAASAASYKPYSVAFTPAALAAGGTGVAVTATVTNPPGGSQDLGSLDITPPSGVEILSRDGTGYTVVGGHARFLNLAIAPGTSRDLALTVRAPCTGPLSDWGVRAKQSNDFKGTGNDFDLLHSASSLTASLQGTCTLAWTRKPAAAKIDTPISTVPFTPLTSTGPAPAVTLLDGVGSPRTIEGEPITVTLAFSSADTALGRSSYTVRTDASGTAEFRELQVTKASYVQLLASAGSAVPPPVRSKLFLVQTTARDCATLACKDLALGKQARVDVDTNALRGALSIGMLPESARNELTCEGQYTQISNEFAVVTSPGTDPAHTVFRIGKADLRAAPSTNPRTFEACYGEPAPTPERSAAFNANPEDPATWWFSRASVKGYDPATQTTPFPPRPWDSDGDGSLDGVRYLMATCDVTGGAPPCLFDRWVGGGYGYVEYYTPPSEMEDPASRP